MKKEQPEMTCGRLVETLSKFPKNKSVSVEVYFENEYRDTELRTIIEVVSNDDGEARIVMEPIKPMGDD